MSFLVFVLVFNLMQTNGQTKKINVQKITTYTGLGVLLVCLSIFGKFVTITYVLSFSFLAKRAGVKILLGRSPKPLPPSVPGLLLHF